MEEIPRIETTLKDIPKICELDAEERKKRIEISKQASVKRDLIRDLNDPEGFDNFIASHEFTPEQKEYILFNMNRLRKIASLTYSQFIGEYERYLLEINGEG